MFDPTQYELLDFGDGRKLERFGEFVLDRPSPAAASNGKELSETEWREASAQFKKDSRGEGCWEPAWPAESCWMIQHRGFQMELKPTDFGHLGVFPEHASAWDWVEKMIRAEGRPLKVLNLFAYTGAATLAAAQAGASVVHVDSAKNIVQWARRNAQRSSLEQAPTRWITEDAMRFVNRELKRGNRYDAIILDPPTYGHGPTGEVWKVSRDLNRLLKACAALTKDQLAFVLLSCHSSGFGPADLQAAMLAAFFGGACQAGGSAGEMTLQTVSGRRLNCGAFARWPG